MPFSETVANTMLAAETPWKGSRRVSEKGIPFLTCLNFNAAKLSFRTIIQLHTTLFIPTSLHLKSSM